jgi:hypothetical protein
VTLNVNKAHSRAAFQPLVSVDCILLLNRAMGAVLAKATKAMTPAPAIYLSGRATKISPSGVRVCVSGLSSLTPQDGKRSRPREICAVSTRSNRRGACDDACHTACNNLPHGRGMRRVKFICKRDCAPACDQPARVTVTSFERIIGGPNGE